MRVSINFWSRVPVFDKTNFFFTKKFIWMHIHGIFTSIEELFQFLVTIECDNFFNRNIFLEDEYLPQSLQCNALCKPWNVFSHCHLHICLFVEVFYIAKQQSDAHVSHRVLSQLMTILFGIFVSHLSEFLFPYISIIALVDNRALVDFILDFCP